MAEQIAGDLVRKSRVFLFPFFLFYCEKHICYRSCCKSSLDVRLRAGKVDRLSARNFPISGWNNKYNQKRKN